MAGTHLPTSCPRCGNVAEARTLDGVTVKICCRVCGYEECSPILTLRMELGGWDSSQENEIGAKPWSVNRTYEPVVRI